MSNLAWAVANSSRTAQLFPHPNGQRCMQESQRTDGVELEASFTWIVRRRTVDLASRFLQVLRQDRGSLVTLVHEPGFGECPLRDGLHHRSHCRPGWHMMPYPRGISSLTNFTAISISGALLSIHNQAFCIAEEFGVRENHQLDQGTLEEMVAFQKFETRCLRNM